MKQQPNTYTCPSCGHKKPGMPSARLIEQRRKAARALANHLVFALNIPQSKQLVFILGNGSENDNHEAAAHWVLGKIAHLNQWPLPADEVHELITELERELRETLSDLEHGRFYV
ncbi:MAG TPA: hypothetical protein VKA31_08375 [Mariprofundaceae bacterium]|nr:hypothetical protein [Mariprofundaceae bacterium]